MAFIINIGNIRAMLRGVNMENLDTSTLDILNIDLEVLDPLDIDISVLDDIIVIA